MGIDLNKTEKTVECRLKITEEMKENLLKATKWIKFINIVGCISMGFLAIVGIIAIFWGFMDGYRGTGSCIPMGIIYIILAAIYYPVLKRIFSFINQARSACSYDDNKELNDMFDSLRYVSKYFGIICLVFLGIYAFAIIVAIMATVF